MIVYQGADIQIKEPDIFHSRKNVDFGPGFYVTPIYTQAEKFKRQDKTAVVNIYSFDEKAYEECQTLIFDSYSENWLDHILNNRRGIITKDYEIIQGGVANDKVFNTIELYLDNLIDKKEALKRLKYEKPNLQICNSTQAAIDKYLKFEGSEVL